MRIALQKGLEIPPCSGEVVAGAHLFQGRLVEPLGAGLGFPAPGSRRGGGGRSGGEAVLQRREAQRKVVAHQRELFGALLHAVVHVGQTPLQGLELDPQRVEPRLGFGLAPPEFGKAVLHPDHAVGPHAGGPPLKLGQPPLHLGQVPLHHLLGLGRGARAYQAQQQPGQHDLSPCLHALLLPRKRAAEAARALFVTSDQRETNSARRFLAQACSSCAGSSGRSSP